MLGPIIGAIPKYTKGKLALVPKQKDGTPLTSRVDALELPRVNAGYLLPPPGTRAVESIAKGWVKMPPTRSRNGKRSWTTSVVCRSRSRANYL